jgi:hypothetical protein
MKKLTLSLGLSLLSAAAWAQTGAYVRATLGYGIGANKDVLGVSSTTNADGTYTQSNVYNTVGSGVAAGLAGGYFFSEHLGFDLEAYYLHGSKVLTSAIKSPGSTEENFAYTRQFRLSPSLVIRSGGERLRSYARFGLLLPVGGKTVIERMQDVTAPTAYTTSRITEVKGAFSVGFTSAVGLQFGLTKNLALFGELNYAGLRIKSKTGEITEDKRVDADGTVTDYLADPNRTTFSRQLNFVDELNERSNTMMNPAAYDANKPMDTFARRSNFNNIGLRVGVIFSFSAGE